MSDKPSRVSIVPPLPEEGIFKIEKRNDGILTATPTKEGKTAASPSHVYDPYTKEWQLINEEDPGKLSHEPLPDHVYHPIP